MTQIATVEKKLEPGFVEISVPRKSACGHDCEECAGCGMTGAAIHARASDPIGVEPGDKVVVQSETKKLLGVVALVYLLPVIAFLLGYFLSDGLAEKVRAETQLAQEQHKLNRLENRKKYLEKGERQKLPRNYPETTSGYNARTKRNYRFPA